MVRAVGLVIQGLRVQIQLEDFFNELAGVQTCKISKSRTVVEQGIVRKLELWLEKT